MDPNQNVNPHDLGLDPGRGDEQEAVLPMYRLDDDMVKLVPYTIVSVRRDAERVMPNGAGTIVVTENMTGAAFAAWLLSRYLDSDDYRKARESEKLAPHEEKYLRVHYAVARRWPREGKSFEKRQLAALENIRDTLQDRWGGAAPDEERSQR